MKTHLVKIYRDTSDEAFTREVKDPTIAKMPDGSYVMYASMGGVFTSDMGRLRADHPQGPWQLLGPATVHGLEGPEICAPAVTVRQTPDGILYTMYVQSSCFAEDGVIAVATSTDGENFHASPVPVITKNSVDGGPHKLVGVYDAAVSDIKHQGQDYECLVFSGYRKVGCGDLYMAMRPKDAANDSWSTPKIVLMQEDVLFHNQPGSTHYEWGLEGAKIMQMADDVFILVGVCFLDKDVKHRGTRQRVFLAAANSIDGPYMPMDMPFAPVEYDHGAGENGHADMIELDKDKMAIMYQERAGEGRQFPWHLRYAEIPKDDLVLAARKVLGQEQPQPAVKNKGPKFG